MLKASPNLERLYLEDNKPSPVQEGTRLLHASIILELLSEKKINYGRLCPKLAELTIQNIRVIPNVVEKLIMIREGYVDTPDGVLHIDCAFEEIDCEPYEELAAIQERMLSRVSVCYSLLLGYCSCLNEAL